MNKPTSFKEYFTKSLLVRAEHQDRMKKELIELRNELKDYKDYAAAFQCYECSVTGVLYECVLCNTNYCKECRGGNMTHRYDNWYCDKCINGGEN